MPRMVLFGRSERGIGGGVAGRSGAGRAAGVAGGVGNPSSPGLVPPAGLREPDGACCACWPTPSLAPTGGVARATGVGRGREGLGRSPEPGLARSPAPGRGIGGGVICSGAENRTKR
jgi:hypothetical protein